MREPLMQWQVFPSIELSAEFVDAVRAYLQDAEASGQFAATLLWQRGWREPKAIAGFLDANRYQPTSPLEFGIEMQLAIDRLLQARDRAEFVAIWGDFDADGITATAVLWEGLGQFFSSEQLTYTIPNRLRESHGLSIAGLDALAAQGVRLIVTCDTGSTNRAELDYAQAIGLAVIVTDHHTLPAERPPVTAILNPRSLPIEHPLAHLSGVAVAYKLVEALYEALPTVPDRPLTDLLDLVAIGLIADLVQLRGDCRYLAQRGLEQLQRQSDPLTASRPGIARLLELCKRSGDRPTDISFGIGPRINAISRIHGDARFGVELLTSRDRSRCLQLASETELANTRRKALQQDLLQQVQAHLAQLDLATTSVIVLSDPQWPIGVLGLVAGQIAQQYGRPTILLSEEVVPPESDRTPLAIGSARSTGSIDLYQLVQAQTDLLRSFGGHPFAAGLSLPVANLPLFRAAVNQALRQQTLQTPLIAVDLTVTIADLGGVLFRELKLLEPYGIGNPPPRLLIRNCWFRDAQTEKIQDWKGGKIRYRKASFKICDETGEFSGVWWEHTPADLPQGRCDAIVELDSNTYQKRYEIRLVDWAIDRTLTQPAIDWLLDWRTEKPIDPPVAILQLHECPSSWEEFYRQLRQGRQTGRSIALAYRLPPVEPPEEQWQSWLGLAKFLSRSGEAVTRSQMQAKFGWGDRAFTSCLNSLKKLGFVVIIDSEESDQMTFQLEKSIEPDWSAASQAFIAAVREEQFLRQYFCQVDLAILQAAAQQAIAL